MRIPTLATMALIAASASIAGASEAIGQATADWPMAGGDASHAATAALPEPPYRRVWTTRIEGGAVAGASVLDETLVAVGTRHVVALSAETGETLWEIEREEGPSGPPAIAGDVAVYAEGRGADAAIVATRLTDGEEAWRLPTSAPVVGGPTVEEDRLYAAARDGGVHAVDVRSGERAWDYDAGGRVETAPAVSEGLVLVASENFRSLEATVHALDASSGREEWRYSPEGVGVGVSSISVRGDLAIVGLGDRQVHALELESGRERWATLVRAAFSARLVPAVPADVVIGDRVGHVYRLDGSSGAERWVFRLPGHLLFASPAAVGGAVVVGDASGQASAIDLESGRLVWKEQLSGAALGGIAVASARAFVTSRDEAAAVIALEHDARARLLDEPSPTTLFVVRALLNYAVAFAVVLAGLLVLFRVVFRGGGLAPNPPETRPAGWRET